MKFADIWDDPLHIVQEKTGTRLAIPLSLRCNPIDWSPRICVLADNDKLTQCPEGSYAVIEDSGYYASLLVMGNEAWTIHPNLLPTVEDALDLIAERRGIFV